MTVGQATASAMDQMNVAELRAWLDVTGIDTLCITLNADPDAPGHETAVPRWTQALASDRGFRQRRR